MSETNPLSIRDMQAHVLRKSTQDAAFREALLADAKATVEKEFNLSLPAHFRIDAIDSPAHTLTLVLPHVPATSADGEMNDQDLEAVAGGAKSFGGDFLSHLGYDLSGVESVIAVGAGNVIAVGAGNVIAVGAGNLLGNASGAAFGIG